MGTAKVTDIRKKVPGMISPVVVSFQNGSLAESTVQLMRVVLSTAESSDTHIEVFSKQHRFIDGNPDQNSQTQILAIRNKKTNKVRLIEAGQALLLNSVLMNVRPMLGLPEENKNPTYTLEKKFGGKKSIRKLERREKLKIDPSLVQKDLEKSMQGVEVTNLTSKAEPTFETITPPCNRDANDRTEVYKLSDILTEEEISSMKEEITEITNDKNYAEKYSPFFQSCLQIIKTNPSEEKLAALLFAQILMSFLKIDSKKISYTIGKLCGFSPLIRNKIINEFCVKTEKSICRPLSMRDKALCYIIVLVLLCCDYEVNIEALQKSLYCSSCSITKLAQLCRVVGLTPLMKGTNRFVLKLPMPAAPKPNQRNMNKKMRL